MPRYVAFLRALNVGKRRLTMEKLKSLFEDLGFEDVSTFIASGNVHFASPARDAAKLGLKISAHVEKNLGYEATAFVRTWTEMEHLAGEKHFPDEDAPGHKVYVAFFNEAISSAAKRHLLAIKTPAASFRVTETGREFIWLRRTPLETEDVWTSSLMHGLELPMNTLRNRDTLRKWLQRDAV